MLVLLAGRSSLGKESSVQEHRETVTMINCSVQTIILNSNCKGLLTDKKVCVSFISS